MSLQVELSAYEKYLKYRRPEGFEFAYSGDKTHVWIPDGPDNYALGYVLEENDINCKVTTPEGKESILSKEAAAELRVNPPKFDGVEDYASVLHNLRLRYDADIFYTYSGLFLVSLNPYKQIPVYTQPIIDMYMGKRRDEMAPHVFSSADVAYRYMLEQQRNQSMLITGESGAGKTENTKKVIQYLAGIAGRSGTLGELEKQLLQANPLLEALGNAKTLKNNNSSRFGKFIRITFDKSGFISGASIVSYLLERSRVVTQSSGERSFHIFYQLCAGLNVDQKRKYYIEPPESYKFLSGSGCTMVKDVNDAHEYTHTLDAMHILGFTEAEVDTLISVVAGVLQLGNIEFQPENHGEASSIRDHTPLERASELLAVPSKQLEDGLLRPRIKAGRDLVTTSLTPEKAAHSRDALCKVLYGRMFLWVVERINQTLQVKTSDLSIGILDIAGFEIFKFNSFEQLCINYTNERLQHFFNNHMFTLEQEEYKREKLDWTMMNFGIDSQVTIDLIEKRPKGILTLLDEEAVFPSATDQTFIAKLNAAQEGKNPKYRKNKVGASDLTFTVVHYAGDVEYDTTSWLEKNKDPLQHDLEACFKDSKNPHLAAFVTNFSLNASVSDVDVQPNRSSSRKKGSAFITVAYQYKEQLMELMDALGATHPHFIRCILPNRSQVPGKIEDAIVLDQLRCNGVLEGIRISRKGFPNRLYYAEFLKRYYLLVPGVPKKAADPKAAVIALIEALKSGKVIVDDDQYRLGLTKVFFRSGIIGHIEEFREKRIGEFVPVIQTAVRGYLARKYLKKLHEKKHATLIIQRNIRAWLEFKNWPWFKLYIKARPLLKRRNFEKEIEQHQQEIIELQKSLADEVSRRKSLDEAIVKIEQEHQQTSDQLSKLLASHADLENNKEESDKMAALLETKLATLKLDLEDRDISLEESDRIKESIQQRLYQLEKELDEEILKSDQLVNEKKHNLIQLEELHSQLDAVQKDLSSLKGENDKLVNELTDALSAKDGESNAKEQLLRLRKKLEDQLSGFSDECQKLQCEKRDAENQIANYVQDVKELKRNLEAASGARTAVEAQIKNMQSQLDDAHREIDKVSKLHHALQKSKILVDEELEDLRNNLDDESRTSAETLKKLRKAKETIEELQENLDQEADNRDLLLQEQQKLENELDALRRQLEEANATISRLEKANAGLQNQLKDLEFKLQEVEHAHHQLLSERNQLKLALDNALEEGDAFRHRSEATEKAKSKIELEAKNLARDLEAQRASNINLDRELKKLQSNFNSLRDQLESAEKARDTIGRSKKDVELRTNELEEDLAAIQDERNAFDRKLKSIESKYEDLQSQYDELRDERDDIALEHSKVGHNFEELQRQMDMESDHTSKLNMAIKNLESELDELRVLLQQEQLKSSNLIKLQKKEHSELIELNSSLSAKENSLQKSVKQCKKLEAELKQAKRIESELNNALSSLEEDTRRVGSVADESQRHIEQLESQIVGLEKQRKLLQSQLKEAEESANEWLIQKQKLEHALTSLEDELLELRESSEHAESLQQIEANYRKLELECKKLAQMLDLAELAKSKANDEKIQSDRALHECHDKLNAEVSQAAKLKHEYKTIANANESLKAELAMSKSNYDNLVKKFKKFEKEVKQQASKMDDQSESALELKKVKLQLIESNQKLEQQRNSIQSLERRANDLVTQLKESSQALEDERKKSANLLRSNKMLENDISLIRDQLEDEGFTISQLNDAKSKQELEIAELRRQLESVSQSQSKSESSLKLLERTVVDLKSSAEESSFLLEDRENQIKSLQQDLEEMNSRHLASSANYTKLEKARKVAQKELQLSKDHLAKLQMDKEEQEHLASKYREELTFSENQLAQERAQRLAAQKESKSLRIELEDVSCTIQESNRSKSRAEQEFRQAQLALTECKTECVSLQERITGLENTQSAQSDLVANIRTSLDYEVSNRSSIEESKRALERQISDCNDQLERERLARNDVEKSLKKAQDEIEDLQNKQSSAQSQMIKSEKHKARAQQEVQDLQRTLGEYQKRHFDATSRLELELKKAKTRLEDELIASEEAQSNARRTQSTLAKLRSDFENQHSELESLKSAYDESKRECNELRHRADKVSSLFRG